MARNTRILSALGAALIVFTLLITLVEPARSQANSGRLIGVHEFSIAGRTGSAGGDPVAMIREVGAQIVRLPITWHLMEGDASGQTPDWFWQGLDAEVAAAERAGVKLLIEMGNTPCWASSDPNKRCDDGSYDAYLRFPPRDPADYGRALARVAQRYRGRVHAYEIWNEPNLVGSWPPFGPRPRAENDSWDGFADLRVARQYAEMVKATYPKVKAADPGATVLAGAIAGGDGAFLGEMYRAGAKGFFDALSMHPYTAPYPVSQSDPRYGTSYGPNECPAGVEAARLWCFKVGVERVRQVMLDQGDARPVWFSEFGFSSTTVWNGSGRNGQAEHLRQAVELINGWPFVTVAIWYQLVDLYDADDREGRFGLFDRQGRIKPAGQMFKQLLRATPATPTSTATATPPPATPTATATPPPATPAPSNGPVLLSPSGAITTAKPTFKWRAVPGATRYLLWVNEYSDPNVPGKIRAEYSATAAGCNSDTTCKAQPRVRLSVAGEWWVTASMGDGSTRLSNAMTFSIRRSLSGSGEDYELLLPLVTP